MSDKLNRIKTWIEDYRKTSKTHYSKSMNSSNKENADVYAGEIMACSKILTFIDLVTAEEN